MGRQDNWTTPKQIKIERAGEPRASHRGPLQKRKRRKGLKARLDEVRSALQSLKRANERLLSAAKNQPVEGWWMKSCREDVVRSQARYNDIVAECKRDKIDLDLL